MPKFIFAQNLIEPTLTSAVVSFKTRNDNKDDDSKLDIWMELSSRGTFAKKLKIYGEFDDNSYQSFPLIINEQIKKSQVRGSYTKLFLSPNGNDTWKFNIYINLTFTDGTSYSYTYNTESLSQEVRQKSYPHNVNINKTKK